jgi:hypothetical protein
MLSMPLDHAPRLFVCCLVWVLPRTRRPYWIAPAARKRRLSPSSCQGRGADARFVAPRTFGGRDPAERCRIDDRNLTAHIPDFGVDLRRGGASPVRYEQPRASRRRLRWCASQCAGSRRQRVVVVWTNLCWPPPTRAGRYSGTGMSEVCQLVDLSWTATGREKGFPATSRCQRTTHRGFAGHRLATATLRNESFIR